MQTLAERFDLIRRIITKRIRLVRINRNLLVYLVFLILSIVFWFLQTLKETTSINQQYKIELVNIPRRFIITSDIPDEVNVTLQGRGYSLLEYMSQNNSHTIQINFPELAKSNSHFVIDQNLLRRLVTRNLPGSVKFASSSPSNIEVFYSLGESKRVPVVFGGHITTETQHNLCGIKILPDSVDIVAPKSVLDSINFVPTASNTYKNLQDTLHLRQALRTPKGVRITPDSVEVEVCVDLFTEKTLSVPIYCENIPSNKILRTFPLKANISFQVSTTKYNSIRPEQFVVAVDFTSIKPGDKTCHLNLKLQPEGISHVRIQPENVDYIVENE